MAIESGTRWSSFLLHYYFMTPAPQMPPVATPSAPRQALGIVERSRLLCASPCLARWVGGTLLS